MNSNKRTTGLLAVDLGGGVQHMIIAGGGEPRSVLESFTSGEISSMMQWARTQHPDNGSMNLMNWPGWQDACERLHLDASRAREVAAALLARLGASPTP